VAYPGWIGYAPVYTSPVVYDIDIVPTVRVFELW
jgi:hypothetical protein